MTESTDSESDGANRATESRTNGLPEFHDSWYRNGTMREEVRETVEQQVSWLEQLNEKALGLLRFNVTFLGLLVPVLSFVVEFGGMAGARDFYNLHVGLGVLSFVVSTAGAGVTYTSSSMATGMSDSDVATAKQRGLTDAELHDALVENYAYWIRSNRRTLHRNATLITVTVGLSIAAIALLSLGFASALFDGLPRWVQYATYLSLVLALVSSQYV